MSEKVLSPKMFLHRASQSKGAIGFLAQYRSWMETGELADVLSPILRKIDEKEVFPTPGLELIKNAVLSHYLASQVRQAEEHIAKREVQKLSSSTKAPKNYVAHVYDVNGNELYKPAAHSSDTSGIRWADRRLIKEAPGSYGIVENIAMFDREGNPLELIIHRDDAFARLLKQKKGPVVQRKGQGLSTPHIWHAKMRQTRSSFSHG